MMSAMASLVSSRCSVTTYTTGPRLYETEVVVHIYPTASRLHNLAAYVDKHASRWQLWRLVYPHAANSLLDVLDDRLGEGVNFGILGPFFAPDVYPVWRLSVVVHTTLPLQEVPERALTWFEQVLGSVADKVQTRRQLDPTDPYDIPRCYVDPARIFMADCWHLSHPGGRQPMLWPSVGLARMLPDLPHGLTSSTVLPIP